MERAPLGRHHVEGQVGAGVLVAHHQVGPAQRVIVEASLVGAGGQAQPGRVQGPVQLEVGLQERAQGAFLVSLGGGRQGLALYPHWPHVSPHGQRGRRQRRQLGEARAGQVKRGLQGAQDLPAPGHPGRHPAALLLVQLHLQRGVGGGEAAAGRPLEVEGEGPGGSAGGAVPVELEGEGAGVEEIAAGQRRQRAQGQLVGAGLEGHRRAEQGRPRQVRQPSQVQRRARSQRCLPAEGRQLYPHIQPFRRRGHHQPQGGVAEVLPPHRD